MAITIVATVGATNANSYATLAEAQTYMDGRLEVSEWDTAETDIQNRALKQATDRLEQLKYKGTKTDEDQRLSWPRFGVLDLNEIEIASDTIPRRVKEAQFEIALALLKGQFSTDDSELAGFNRVKVDVIEVEPNHGKRAATIPEYVFDTLAHLLAGSQSRHGFPVEWA